MTSPLKGGISGHRYNRTLHGRSVYRKIDVPGHNIVVGYIRPGVGDALDIFVPPGTPVFAMHSGRISRIADRGGRLSCLYVAAKDILTVYAHIHIHSRISLGESVSEGDLIGWVDRKLKDPHLHLEMWIGGKSLAAVTPIRLAQVMSNNLQPL